MLPLMEKVFSFPSRHFLKMQRHRFICWDVSVLCFPLGVSMEVIFIQTLYIWKINILLATSEAYSLMQCRGTSYN